MNISSWTVRMRLTLGFGAVCALMLVILGVGLFSMSRIENGVTTIVDDRIPKIDAAHTVSAQVDSIAIALRNMMLTSDAADRKKQIDGIAKDYGLNPDNITRELSIPDEAAPAGGGKRFQIISVK